MENCGKKKGLYIADIFLFLLLIVTAFSFGFSLDFSTGTEPHLFFIKFTEVICGIIWLYVFYKVILLRRKLSWDLKTYVILMVFFGSYYVVLSVARYITGGNITDSLWLFRSILFVSVIYILLTAGRWQPHRIYRIALAVLLILTVGYVIQIIRTENFATGFPDYPMTYLSIASMAQPVLFYGLSHRKGLSMDGLAVFIASFLLSASTTIIFFAGTRTGFIFLILTWCCCPALFYTRGDRRYLQIVAAVVLVTVACTGALYATDTYYCRSGAARGATQSSTSLFEQDNAEQIQQTIDVVMEERKQLIQENERQRAFYNDPVDLSNSMRKYVYLLMWDQQKGDWVFSLNGNTSFEYNLFGAEITSGTHNFFFDYMLAFGLVGTLILGAVLGIPVIQILRFTKKGDDRRQIYTAFLLSNCIYFGYGMVQETFNSTFNLAWMILLIAFWYNVTVLPHKREQSRTLCMLVTSGVINDSRVIREATLAEKIGFETILLGRYEEELGPEPEWWSFTCERLHIARVKGGIVSKIVERSRLGLALAAATVKKRPDIIHCNDFDTLPFGYACACLCNAGIVYDSHEIWSENERVADSALGKWFVKVAERYFSRRCDAVISVSNSACAWLKAAYKLENITVVTNCPLIENVQQMPKNPGFELLFHGQLTRDRGCEELIECAPTVREYGITIRFRGYGPKTEYYLEHIRKIGQDNILFCEKVPSDQVASAATASHVGVALTRPVTKSFELTVSNKLFEYIAAGLPVILSDVPEHRYLNEKYHFGIILPDMTAQALAEAAIRLKEDANLYHTMAENAVIASKELCFEREGQKLAGIYQRISKERTKESACYEADFA